MLTKRFLVLCCVIVLLGLSMSVAAQDAVKLTLAGWSSSPEEDAALQALLTQFKDETGIDVEFVPSPDHPTTMQTAFASGEYANVFYIDSSKLPDWVEAGVVDVGEDQIENPDGFYPALLDIFVYDGILYCPPKDFSTMALQYNKDLFDAAKVEYPTADWTWDDLKDAATKLTDKDKGIIGLVTPPNFERWLPFLYQAGGAIFDEDGNYAMDSDEARAALDYYISFSTEGIGGPPSVVDSGWGGEAFGKGVAAMAMEGNWAINFLLTTYPELNWGVAELPMGTAGKATMAFTVCYGVGAANDHPEESWQLVNFLTGEDGQKRAAEVSFGPMPTRPSAAETYLETWVARTKDSTFNPEDVNAFIAGADYSHRWQLPPGWQPFIDSFNGGLQQAFSGDMKTEDVIAEANLAAEEVGQE
jgi:multiple sugar transport system substrate-binding protein